MAIVPSTCAACGGGGSSSPEFNDSVVALCDTLADGTVVATVLVTRVYDEATGLPTGIQVTDVSGNPYTPVGVVKACENAGSTGIEVLCDTNGAVVTAFVRHYEFDATGAVTGHHDVNLDGTVYAPTGTVGNCSQPQAPVFAGFVCDSEPAVPEQPATPPTCPGAPLAAPAALIVGAGMTEGPAGTYTQTSSSGASLAWQRSSPDAQHGLCSIEFVNDASTGNNPEWQLLGTFVDANGNTVSLDAVWITAIETALGVGDASDIPSGSSASAVTSGTTVTITFNGPSQHSQMFASNGAFFLREGDGDGLAAGVKLDFSPPIQSFQLALNNAVGDPGTISGLQESQATPGTAAVPASPASLVTVKQFRNSDGTAFYENLDGTAHAVVGAIGDCGQFFSEQLCDATGAPFVRLYSIGSGAVTGFQDYDLDGATFAPTAPVGVCGTQLATYRHTPAEVLCYTASDDVTVTTFLRRYLITQDGLTVVAVLDTQLDGTTAFTPVTGGTVGVCSDDSGSTATPCSTASSIGTICYTPPAFTPAVTLTSNWSTSVIAGTSPGPQTFTLNNFGGDAGRTVVASLNKGAGLTGNDILLGIAPTTAGSLYHEHLDFGGAVTGLSITFHSFGTLGSEVLLNLSPPADSVSGAGTLSGGNTVVNPTTSNGTVTVTWNGPLSVLDFDWKSTAGGTLSTLSNVTFTTVPSGSSTATAGTAAVLVDCVTGAVTYRDLATGQILDISTVTIVDCPVTTSTAVALSAQARLVVPGSPWTPATDVVGTLTSASFTVIAGTASFVDADGTTVGPLPTGSTFAWDAEDSNSLVGPKSVTPAAGGSVLATWTHK